MNNWSNDAVPTSEDVVTIDTSSAINLVGVQSALSLTMTGGGALSLLNSSLSLGAGPSTIAHLTLTGTGTVSTFGDLTLSGTSSMAAQAVLAGPGTIFNTGTLTVNGSPQLQTELQNTGTITHTPNGLFDAWKISGPTAKVRVFGGGVYNLLNGSQFQRLSGGQGVFIEVGGTMQSTGGATNGALVVDGGNVNVTANSLVFNSASSLHDATFNVASGAHVYFNSNQSNAVSGTITGTGAGQVIINGSSSFDLASDTVFNFAPSQLVFQNSASINGPGTLTNVGYVHGTPVLKTQVLNTGTFAPAGTVIFSGANAELRILAGGTFSSTGVGLAGDASSKGLIVESGGTLKGSTSTGAIPVQVLGGTIKTASAASVAFSGPTSLVGAILDTTGGGQILFQDGSITTLSGVITGTGSAGTVTFQNGSATFNATAAGATLDFPANMAVFDNVTINGPGVLTSVGELLFQPSNMILRTELRIEGKLNLVGTNPNLTIDGAGGLLRIADGGWFFGSSNINGHNIVASNGGLPPRRSRPSSQLRMSVSR